MADDQIIDEINISEDASQETGLTSDTTELDQSETAQSSEITEPESETAQSSEITEPEMESLKSETVSNNGTSLLSQLKNDDKNDQNLQKQEGRKGWYVIHTYSGYEDQVAESLKQRAESFGMEDRIYNVVVPKEKQIEIKNGKRKTVEKRIFPGYVMVEMIVTDDSWYVVRNTPNVTGFIGLGVQPTPIASDEVARIQKRMGVEEPKYKIELRTDDLVKITDGPLKSFEGKVTDVDEDKGKVKVSVSMFGRETPVSLDFLQVKKI